MKTFFPLKIKEIIRETPQAVSLEFDVPEELRPIFLFKAGQYITIKAEVDGKEIRRAYSICSPPNSDSFRVTVKEVEGGKFSAVANNKLKGGDVLQVHPPEGRFTYEPKKGEAPKTYAAFAAGSGITPILSILKTVLTQDRENRFILVYGNRTVQETIFFQELLNLQSTYPDRLVIKFIYSRGKEEGFFSGRIDETCVDAVFNQENNTRKFNKFYLCGPETMINNTKKVLLKYKIEEERIAYELFQSTEEGTVSAEIDGFTEVTVLIDDEETSFRMKKATSVMEAALDLGIDIPYSCQGGTCSTCVARITEGEATMKKNMILADSEIEEGLVLTCQAYPNSEILKLNYNNI